jgi:hypothetical protein
MDGRLHTVRRKHVALSPARIHVIRVLIRLLYVFRVTLGDHEADVGSGNEDDSGATRDHTSLARSVAASKRPSDRYRYYAFQVHDAAGWLGPRTVW